jgi:hypothetical protein
MVDRLEARFDACALRLEAAIDRASKRYVRTLVATHAILFALTVLLWAAVALRYA